MSTGNIDQDGAWLNLNWDLDSSMTNPDFTYSYSKFSCVRFMFWVHISIAYTIMGIGLCAMLTRAIRPLRFLHVLFGRTYVILMLWASTTALLINNTGLPVAVLISFFIIIWGLTLGYSVIFLHYREMNKGAFEKVQADIKATGQVPADLQRAVNEEKGNIADAKTVWQRVFSWKALHGSFFFVSWLGIFLRLVVTPIDINEYVCYTYPYFKPVNSTKYAGAGNEGLVPVPIQDPSYMEGGQGQTAPWFYTGNGGWAMIMSFGMMTLALFFGTFWALGERAFIKPKQKFDSIGSDGDEGIEVAMEGH